MNAYKGVFSVACIVMLSLAGCGRSTLSEMAMDNMHNTSEPSLSVAEDGTVTLSYLREAQDSVELFMRTLQGDRWSSPRLVARGNDLLVNWADFPSVIKVDGKFVAQWMVRHPGPGFAYDVYVADSTDEGVNWSEPERLHADTAAVEHGFVSLYADRQDVGAFWLDGRRYADANEMSKGMELRHRRLVAGGVEEVVDDLVCDCCQTDSTVLNGNPIAVFRDRTKDEIRDISVARKDAGTWSTTTVADDGWNITGCPGQRSRDRGKRGGDSGSLVYGRSRKQGTRCVLHRWWEVISAAT